MKEIKFDNKEYNFLISLLNDNTDKIAKSIKGKLERSRKQIKVSSAKAKGRDLQYFVCEQLSEITGCSFNQNDDNSLIQSRPMGQHNKDIILRGEVYDKIPFDIECKAQETLSIPKWVEQAKLNTEENRYMMIVFKKKSMGSKPYVVLEWDGFRHLLEI